MMSKSKQIIDLLCNTDLSNKEIAERVGCRDAYVRTVQQRLANGGQTKSNERWRANNADKVREMNRGQASKYHARCGDKINAKRRERYWSDPEFRAKCLANSIEVKARQRAKQAAE